MSFAMSTALKTISAMNWQRIASAAIVRAGLRTEIWNAQGGYEMVRRGLRGSGGQSRRSKETKDSDEAMQCAEGGGVVCGNGMGWQDKVRHRAFRMSAYATTRMGHSQACVSFSPRSHDNVTEFDC